MRTRKRAIIKPVGQVAIQSDWVRVVRTEGDKVYPVTGAGPEDKLRVRMKVMARRNPGAQYSLCPVVQEVLG